MVNDEFVDALIESFLRPSPYAAMPPPPKPLTRKQRLRAKWLTASYRIRTAVDVLRGRHECEE